MVALSDQNRNYNLEDNKMSEDENKPTDSNPVEPVVMKPCPFCGSSNVEEDWGSVVQGSCDYQYGDITCLDCDGSANIELRGKEVDAEGEEGGSARLLAKWNKRSS